MRHEAIEQVGEIVRTRSSPRDAPWKLNAGLSVSAIPCRLPSNSDTCVTRTLAGKRRHDRPGEAVVLTGDQDLPGVLVEHRVVGAMMAELHLHGLAPVAEPEQLVPEADAEGRRCRRRGIADRRRSRNRTAPGSPGPLDRKTPSGLQRQAPRARRLRRNDGQAASALGEHAQDVVLDAEIVGDDVKSRRLAAAR